MITIVLALLAQAQPAAAAPSALSAAGSDAMRCAAATGMALPATASGDERMRAMAAVTFHVMTAARSDRGAGPIIARIQDLTPMVDQYKPSGSLAAALAADCRARFPLAWTTAPARLPADPFTRDVMCMMAISVMAGSGESLEEDSGDPTYADRYHAAQKRFSDRLTDPVLAKRGITTPAQYEALAGDQLLASLALGNVGSITATCEALKI